jgi:hypothetical protein
MSRLNQNAMVVPVHIYRHKMKISLLVVKVFKTEEKTMMNENFKKLYVETRCGLYLSLLDAKR